MRNALVGVVVAVVLALAAQGRSGAGRRHPVEAGQMPTYPPLALQAGVEGKVTLRLSVRGGHVSGIASSGGNPLLVEPVKRIAASWQFPRDTNAEVSARFVFEVRRGAEPGTARLLIEFPSDGSIRATVVGYRPAPAVLH